ncbi:serine/threonine-protein kinase [Terrabacter sp. Ter38]|uniref:serine/threonine-protein kinase n=1 Tax=Terrabacter sp. Ter38 TaxID=2926030 RepID=UPI002119A231|nr:serine/threonine-protein kinase [Terrabacter sp. Ter38]
MTLSTGATLGGRYTLGSAIASGGMGDVWEASDEVLQRPVAVKVMRPQGPEDDAFLERFRDEARGSASLHHPNIASVFDYGEEDGTAYLVMELVPGRTLGEIIRENDGGMPAEEVRSLLGQAALALSVAHEAGVVHRDVKPANIIVTPEGQAKLTDFGIARVGDGSGHTLTGEVLGTPDYISPEQALGEPATASSDIYSLGVVAHEMITGRKPFDMGSPVATAIAQVNDAPPELPSTVPVDLREVVDACLAKSASDRPADARAVAEAAGVPLASLPGVTPPPAVADATTVIPAADAAATEASAGRRWAWLAVPTVALVAWGAFALGSVLNAGSASPEARSTAPATLPPATSSTPTSTPTANASRATTTAPKATPTRTAAKATAATKQTSIKPQPAHAGKGKGKGKGKAK